MRNVEKISRVVFLLFIVINVISCEKKYPPRPAKIMTFEYDYQVSDDDVFLRTNSFAKFGKILYGSKYLTTKNNR